MNNKIDFKDFADSFANEDDIFLEVNAAGANSTQSSRYSVWCWVSTSVAASLSSLVSASSPANTYTELGCC